MTPKAITVLHILGTLRPSGMERMLASGARAFRDQGVNTLVVGQGGVHPFAEDLREAGCGVWALPALGASIQAARSLRKLVQEQKVDVIHIHTEGNYLRTVLACRLALGLKGRIVRTVHSIFSSSGRWKLSRTLQSVVGDRFVFALVAPSTDVARTELRIGRQTEVIYNWVDDRFFQLRAARRDRVVSADAAYVALIVGNCSAIKNHELALAAIISSKHRLIHIGSEIGASQSEVALLDHLESSGQLIYRGSCSPDVAMMEADYFVMSSRFEGMGVALAEAVVVGLPAVVNDVPGLSWAANFDNVVMVSDNANAWESALRDCDFGNTTSGALNLDFSAERGAAQYTDLYRRASTKRGIRNRSALGFAEANR